VSGPVGYDREHNQEEVRMSEFSWQALSDRVVLELARGEDPSTRDASEARAWLDNEVGCPNDSFVKRHKDVLAKVWMPEYRDARRVVQELQDCGLGPGGRPRTQDGYARFVQKCRNSKTLRRILREALWRLGKTGANGDGRWIRPLAILSPSAQPSPDRPLFRHQREAHLRLEAHLEDWRRTERFQGILQMPTGSGKTLTAVRWLVDRVLRGGDRIVWIAHRHELLEQAADTFYREIGRLEGRDKVRIRVVSGGHCATTQIDLEDDVLLCSVFSLARNLDIAREVLADPRTFVVVDEATTRRQPLTGSC